MPILASATPVSVALLRRRVWPATLGSGFFLTGYLAILLADESGALALVLLSLIVAIQLVPSVSVFDISRMSRGPAWASLGCASSDAVAVEHGRLIVKPIGRLGKVSSGHEP